MLALALTFFLVANPIGNSPAIIALVKNFDFKRQRIILFRESLFALFLALFFQYFGEMFLSALKIQDFAVTIAGGFLLMLVAFGMLFHEAPKEDAATKTLQEPYIVPIATPILSGPGLLAIIMLKSRLATSSIEVSMAILIAWIGVFAVMGTAPYLKKVLGQSGLAALEQVMGMILLLVSVEMIVKGGSLFLKTL